MSTSEPRVVTRDAYPLFTYRCVCGHWEDDHMLWGPTQEHYCYKCLDLADAYLNASEEERETLAEPRDHDHTFERRSDQLIDMDRRMWHVNVYELDRAYGGPEEGGWWYNTGELVQTVPVWSDAWSDDDIEKLCELLGNQYPKEGDRSIGSVLYAGGAHAIVVEPHEGKSWPQERPRYE